MKKINIAIDGPSAAGKSTVSKRVAAVLGYVHLDTGAMYRSTACKALRCGIALDDEQAVCEMLKNTEIVLTPDGKVLLDGEDVTSAIREDAVSMAASNVSKLPQVRSDLVARQQKMAEDKGFVMDGRDIGTVVLKDAELKIYLTASVEARAQRRYDQNAREGLELQPLETIMKEIAERDYQDMHREVSPLRKADDAIEIDSSNMTIEEEVDQILKLAESRMEG